MFQNHKHKRSIVLGLVLLFPLLACALFAPWIAPHNPTLQNLSQRLEPPSRDALFGTDPLGRDVLSRVIYGARISLAVGSFAILFSATFGVIAGAISGYFGGIVDQALMGLIEILMAFPSILLAIAIVAILGPSLQNATLAIGIVSIPVFARFTRALILSLKEQEFALAAKAIGCSDARILFVHLLPNCLGGLVVQAALGIGTAILDLAGLSFLGLGAQPPTPEWGSMLSDTAHYLEKAPWTVIFPGIMVTLSVLAFNLVGDGLRDLTDPRARI